MGKKVDIFRGVTLKKIQVPRTFGSKFFEVM